MPLTPVPGATRLRAMQLGKESTFKTAVAATRRYPWSAVPAINPNWTKTASDTGTLDLAQAPFRKALEIPVTVTMAELYSNDAPTVISAAVMGGLAFVNSGTSNSLTAAPASITQDVFDTYTGEFFDDATADAWTLSGGLINALHLEFPQDSGPITGTADWLFSKVSSYPATPTAGLSVDASPVPLYAGDTFWYINDTAGAIGTSQLVSQIYGATLDLNNNLDPKRFQNGSNSQVEVQNYGRGERVLDFNWQFAKATAAIAESVKWIAASPSERFAEIKTVSSVLASAGIFHSMTWRIPGYWFTRTWDEIVTNTAFSLSGQQIYDTTLGYPFRVQSVSARTALT